MAKYSLQNNRHDAGTVEWSLVAVFGVAAVVFLIAPLLRNPIQQAWRWTSLAHTSATGVVVAKAISSFECFVIATPPQSRFDVVELACNPDSNIETGDYVWYRSGAMRYLVGQVTSAGNNHVVAQMFSTSTDVRPMQVRFTSGGEKFSAVPIGGGSWRVEVPADVEVVDQSVVYHAVSGHPLGTVAAIRIERGSYIKRIFVRLPFSFETLTRLEVE